MFDEEAAGLLRWLGAGLKHQRSGTGCYEGVLRTAAAGAAGLAFLWRHRQGKCPEGAFATLFIKHTKSLDV